MQSGLGESQFLDGKDHAVPGLAHAGMAPYVVVRWRAGRPASAAMASSSATSLREPCVEPAIRQMVSSIRVPPRSLTPPCSTCDAAVGAELDPGGLDVVDPAVQHDPGHRVHRPVVAQGRARPGDPGQVDRRVLVHERQRHELGEPAGLVLDAGQQSAGGPPSAPGCRRGRTSSSRWTAGRPRARW